MNEKINSIIEQLKSLTLLEASELVANVAKETNNFSDELETVSKSPIMFSCKGIVEAYSDMYFKKEKGNTGKQTYKRGEVADFRNFIDELYQLELNLDIFRMSKNQIIAKLNVAFNDRVKKNK